MGLRRNILEVKIMEENKTLIFSLLFTPCKLKVTQHFFLGDLLGSLFPVSPVQGPVFWLGTPCKP